MRRARTGAACALVLALVVAAACSSDDDVRTSEPTVESSSTTIPASTAPPATQAPIPAECTSEAAVAAVAANVDGGLRTDLLGCAGGWMAVDTYTDACPATGEPMEEQCRANDHVAYFQAVDG